MKPQALKETFLCIDFILHTVSCSKGVEQAEEEVKKKIEKLFPAVLAPESPFLSSLKTFVGTPHRIMLRALVYILKWLFSASDKSMP